MDAVLVVVVAASRQERRRLLDSLPADATVLLAPSTERARAVLAALDGPADATGPGLTVAEDEHAICLGDRRVRLTPLEFELLRVLGSDTDRVWSFADLAERVWDTPFVGGGAQVRAVVKRLRRKLADAEAPVAIETVRCAGFRLVDLTTATLPQNCPVTTLAGHRERA
jgi:DNA-binding response OmpR family regulator